MRADAERDGNEESNMGSWQRLSEGLIGGIHHALNNRMGALGGATQVLEADLPPDHPLAGTMSMELKLFEETAGLLRLLTGGDGEFEPVQLEDVVAGSRRLFAVHHALRDLRLDLDSQSDLLPLWTQPAGLLRAILMMMAAAGERCGSRDGEVAMEISGDETVVRILVEVPEGMMTPEEEATTLRISAGDVASTARSLGGEFEKMEGESGGRWILTLPTLPEARRRERALRE